MVDKVTGQMYVLRGDTLERIPEVASHRRREEHSLSVTLHVPGESAGSRTPAIGNTPVPVAESTQQPQSTPGSAGLTVIGEGMGKRTYHETLARPRRPLKAERKAEEH